MLEGGSLEVGVRLPALRLGPHAVCFPTFPVEKLQRRETKDDSRVTGRESWIWIRLTITITWSLQCRNV